MGLGATPNCSGCHRWGRFWFNHQQRERELQIANQRAQTERELAEQGRQDDVLQTYIDQVGQLLLDEDRPLRQAGMFDEVTTLARARTLTTLSRLDGPRKSALMRFLLEARLLTVDAEEDSEEMRYPIIRLMEADLRGVDMTTYDWRGIDMTAAWLTGANLSVCSLAGATLSGASLSGAYLVGTDLSGADLNGADLEGAYLNGADLTGASLFAADLKGADLSDANLSGADLVGEAHRTAEENFLGANLAYTKLSNANLTGADVTAEQLDMAGSLKGVTMPDGLKHP